MNSQDKNYYKILGVRRNATMEDIHRAYRELERAYKACMEETVEISEGFVQEQQNEAAFKEIQEAYDTLSDFNRRQTYNDGIPFTLSGWDGQEDPSSSKFSSRPYALGTFGRDVNPHRRRGLFSREANPNHLLSVSEMISWRKRFLWWFLSFFR